MVMKVEFQSKSELKIYASGIQKTYSIYNIVTAANIHEVR
jgi:hypothetical protein